MNSSDIKGFTIVELMISTVVFSLILMLALAGILQITKLYYQGVTAARTQEVARNAMDEIAEALRFSNEVLVKPSTPFVDGPEIAVGNPDTNYFCLGPKRFTFAVDRQLKESPTASSKEKRHVFWVDQTDGDCLATGAANLNLDDPCSDGSCAPDTSGRELLGENMRVANLDIEGLSSIGSNVFNINLVIAYGDDTSQDGGPLALNSAGTSRQCDITSAIGEYCNVSNLDVIVERRLQ